MDKDAMLWTGVLDTRVEASDRATEVFQMVLERKPKTTTSKGEDKNEWGDIAAVVQMIQPQ